MARTRKRRSDWTPEEEVSEFSELAEGDYLAKCLDQRTEVDFATPRGSVDAAVAYLGGPLSGRALDVGAGEGWATLRLRDRLWRRSGRRHITPHYLTYRRLRAMGSDHYLEVATALDVKICDDRQATLKDVVARRIYDLPGGSFVLEAAVSVVKVRLAKAQCR